MEGAQRDVGVGMLGLQLDGGLQRVLDLAAQPLRQRLGHADALAVAAQRVGQPVVGVGVLGVFGDLCLGAGCHFLEHRQPGLLALFQVGGVDALGLVGDGDAMATRLQPGVMRLLELTGMEVAPGGEHRGFFRQRLGVADVQAGPMLLQPGGVAGIAGVVVGKGGPLGHWLSPGERESVSRCCRGRRRRSGTGARAIAAPDRASAGSAHGRRHATGRRRRFRAPARGAGRARTRS